MLFVILSYCFWQFTVFGGENSSRVAISNEEFSLTFLYTLYDNKLTKFVEILISQNILFNATNEISSVDYDPETLKCKLQYKPNTINTITSLPF